MSLRPRAFVGPAAAVLFVLSMVACDKKDKIIVENPPASQENRPPIIVTYSPVFPPGGIEQIAIYEPDGITLQVLVGDPDGLDDISAVTMDIASVVVRRFILRPDTSTGCLRFSYAPNDTVATQSILAVPATFPGIQLKPLTKTSAGLYAAFSFGGGAYGYPDLFAASSNLETWPGGCLDSEGFGGPWVVLPPAVPVQNEAVLTYLEVDYVGTSITVWDKVGANAVQQLGTLKIINTTLEEKTAAP